jgi:hypothetical protein
MASSFAASLSIVGNVIANQPNTLVLTVTNTGATAANLTGVSVRVTPLGAPVRLSDIFVAPGTNSAGSGTNQILINVPATSGTATLYVQVVCFSGTIGTGTLTQPSQQYYLVADCTADDGSQFSSPAIPLVPANPQFGQPGSPPAVQGDGQLQFNQGKNSALLM